MYKSFINEILPKLTIAYLDSILFALNESRNGRKADKIKRIVEYLDIYDDEIFYGFDSDVLYEIYELIDIEFEFENAIDLRYLLIDYFFPDEDYDEYYDNEDDFCDDVFFDESVKDVEEYGDDQLEKFNSSIVNPRDEISDVLDFVPKIFNQINRSSIPVVLTSSCYLSTDLYRLEREINEQKRMHKINLYLDPRIFSNSIVNSMLNDYDDSWFHYEFTYNMPLMVFLLDQRNSGVVYKTIIRMSRKFFSQEHIAEHLVYQDIKIHATGGTRCISYFHNTLSNLRKLYLVHDKDRYNQLSLFGLYLISEVDNIFMEEFDLSEKYDFSFKNNGKFFLFIKSSQSYESIPRFLNSLGRNVRAQYSDTVHHYIHKYLEILNNNIDFKYDSNGEIIGIHYSKNYDDLFSVFWKEIVADYKYDEILYNIQFQR